MPLKVKAVSQKAQDAASWVGRKLTSPHQRALQGVAAIAVQPIIDYKNKEVDDDTRAVATARTIGKVVSGVVVGVIVRAGCIALMSRFAKTPKLDDFNRYAQEAAEKGRKALGGILAPSVKTVKELMSQGKELEDIYTDYHNGMGTLVGTLVGLFTNVLIDVPITKWMTEGLTPVVKARIDKDNIKNEISMQGAPNTSPAPQQFVTQAAPITTIEDYFIKPKAGNSQGGANG